MQAEILTGLPVDSTSDCEQAILKLIEIGCQKVIITLGDKGAICATVSNREPFFVHAKKVEAIDSTVRFYMFFLCTSLHVTMIF